MVDIAGPSIKNAHVELLRVAARRRRRQGDIIQGHPVESAGKQRPDINDPDLDETVDVVCLGQHASRSLSR